MVKLLQANEIEDDYQIENLNSGPGFLAILVNDKFQIRHLEKLNLVILLVIIGLNLHFSDLTGFES